MQKDDDEAGQSEDMSEISISAFRDLASYVF